MTLSLSCDDKPFFSPHCRCHLWRSSSMQETEIKFDISSNKGGTFPILCKNIHWFKRSEKEWKRQSSQQVRKWITTGLFEGKIFPAMVTGDLLFFQFQGKNCLLNIFPVGKGIFFETWLAHLRVAIKRITPTYCWAEILKQGTPLQIQTKDMVQIYDQIKGNSTFDWKHWTDYIILCCPGWWLKMKVRRFFCWSMILVVDVTRWCSS